MRTCPTPGTLADVLIVRVAVRAADAPAAVQAALDTLAQQSAVPDSAQLRAELRRDEPLRVADGMLLHHVRSSAVERFVLVLVQARDGIRWDDGGPRPRVLAMLASPAENIAEHLGVLSALMRRCILPGVIARLADAESDAAVRALLCPDA